MSSLTNPYSSCFSTQSGDLDNNIEEIFEQDLYESSEDPPREEWSSLILQQPQENYKKVLCEQGLYKPGSGEICTKVLTISDSTVCNHPYFKYPAVKDPGILTALQKPEPQRVYDFDGKDLYLDLCKEFEIMPVRLFHRNLCEDVIDLKYYSVDPTGVRLMCMALTLNRYVKRLDLSFNFLNNDACYHLGQLLADTMALKELILSGCRIKRTGLDNIVACLRQSSLQVLDLSGNEIGDDGLQTLTEQIKSGTNVKKLNLRNNNLGLRAALELADAFGVHNYVTHLDLSWNLLCAVPRGITKLLNTLAESKVLVELKVSWNTLNVSEPLRGLLAVPTLQILDLSNNRLTSEAAAVIAASLFKAKKLEILDLSYNPFDPQSAHVILKKMRRRPVKVQKLLMANIPVTVDFVRELQEVKALNFRVNAEITHGFVLKNYTLTRVDMRLIVLRRMKYLGLNAKKKFRMDIAEYFLQKAKAADILLPSEMIQDMSALNLPILDDIIGELSKAFAGPKLDPRTRCINLKGVVDYVMRLWPDSKAPSTRPTSPPQEPVKGKKGKDKKDKKK